MNPIKTIWGANIAYAVALQQAHRAMTDAIESRTFDRPLLTKLLVIHQEIAERFYEEFAVTITYEPLKVEHKYEPD